MAPSIPALCPLLALFLADARYAGAQSSSASQGDFPYSSSYVSPTVAKLVVAFIFGFFFLGFFSVYFRRCRSGNSTVARPGSGSDYPAAVRVPAKQGLDADVLASFPTMAYAEAKAHKQGKGALECAVCLSEFADDDTLRLLHRCCHVFHIDCIDVWLGAHNTCPVCRADLADPLPASVEETPAPVVRLAEEQDLEAGHPPRAEHMRSSSMAHEVEEVDRYTLRLPENVRREIFAALRRAASMAEPRTRGPPIGRWGFLRTFSLRWWSEGTAAPSEGANKRMTARKVAQWLRRRLQKRWHNKKADDCEREGGYGGGGGDTHHKGKRNKTCKLAGYPI